MLRPKMLQKNYSFHGDKKLIYQKTTILKRYTPANTTSKHMKH